MWLRNTEREHEAERQRKSHARMLNITSGRYARMRAERRQCTGCHAKLGDAPAYYTCLADTCTNGRVRLCPACECDATKHDLAHVTVKHRMDPDV
jgi:hypothetical protein